VFYSDPETQVEFGKMTQQFESGSSDNKALAAVLGYLKDRRLKVGAVWVTSERACRRENY